ncbi:MAG: restriction endonuclease [Solidesulfovibrio sp.]|uniref:restriction endonuclease n=1 Tax=Solidesulfovibrio sp. TaxID=2910990 RepID=UPI0031581F68
MTIDGGREYYVRTPLFPLYSEVRKLLRIWEGIPKQDLRSMQNDLMAQTGTPKNPVDWSDPDQWIEERLAGKSKDLALRIWAASEKSVNPRHTYGSYLFIIFHQLLGVCDEGTFKLTERGRLFVDEDPEVVRKIDEVEGLPKLLSILAAYSPARRSDLLGDWTEYLTEYSKFGTASTIKDTLRRRILNLVERGYISREGNTYSITDAGVAYAADLIDPVEDSSHKQVLQAVRAYNEEQVASLREYLGKMNPYKFEALVKDLLEAMDYEDVVVTKQSGDKGIDVIANYQFGITQIKEVVQVKRQQGTITRPILDQVRGSLPYHQAIRGTIITLGRFAKGCQEAAIYPGAAPITLIDGDKLMELLQKHGVGVKKKQISIIEVDDSYLASMEPESELDPSV